MKEKFEIGLILDRMISSMSESERICAIWNFFEIPEKQVLRFPQLSSELNVIRATELMLFFKEEQDCREWAEKHVEATMESVGDTFLRRLKDESAAPKLRALCGMWFLRNRVVRSRDMNGLLTDNETKLTNVSTVLKELCDDSFIELVEGELKRSSEKEYQLNKLGFSELKNLLYREGFQKGGE